MDDIQSGNSVKKRSNPGRIALMGAIATALAVFNMATNGEAPSNALTLLQYVLLAGGIVALVGGLIMMAKAPN